MSISMGADAPGLVDTEQSRRSVSLSINLPALRQNLATARRLSGGSRQFATIKADAYGHGAVAVARALSPRAVKPAGNEAEAENQACALGTADGFAVVTLGEALELREAGIEQPVLVLQGPQSADALPEMIRHDLWPVIHDLEQHAWLKACPERQALGCWLKVDTGMGRLGVQVHQANDLLAQSNGIRWKGLMTHFACADEVDNPFTQRQIEQFHSVSIVPGMQKSLANSAGVLAWPQARADWARPGIMLYGCNPLNTALPEGVSLVPAMSVSAPLISVKSLPAGSGVGYAQSWHCPEDMPVGYVALGYRDGLPRVLDNTAAVYINGARCPIVGRVSMDSIAVDLRSAPAVALGARAEFWGETAPIDTLAKAAGTISYELLTSIRGKRTYSPVV